MELSDSEYVELATGQECTLHTHAPDKTVTHDAVLQHQDVEGIASVSAAYLARYTDDYIFADTTGGAFAVALPIARGGKFYCVVRIAGVGNVTLTPNGSDTINGTSTLVISASYQAVRLKALKGIGWVQV